jgi:hypothetical protein
LLFQKSNVKLSFLSDDEVVYADDLEYEDETADGCSIEPEVELKDDDVDEIIYEEEEEEEEEDENDDDDQ